MRGETRDLELALREMADVSYVGFDGVEGSHPEVVQVVVTDPERADAVRRRAGRLVFRHIGGEPTVDVQVTGVPRRPLVIEARLSEEPHVAEVVALRGSRGELVRVSVIPTSQDSADTVRQQLLASGVPDDRLEI